MLSVFMDRNGDVLFTYPSVDLHQGDRVRHNEKIYLIVSKTFNVDGKFYEIILHDYAND